jgi:hypothetical protein
VFVVAFGAAFLFSITGYNRRIYIQRKIVKLQIIEKSLVKTAEYLMIFPNTEYTKISLNGFVFRHSLPSV